MRAIVQRVSRGAVQVEGRTVAETGQGLVVLLGVTHSDGVAEAERLADKIAHLRILEDPAGKMNLSVLDTEGAVLVVVPAQWPARRVEHWRTLLRARAIENQMAVVGCNRVGRDGDDSAPFGGCSAVYDPWGRVVVEGNQEEEMMLTGAVDLSIVAQARSFIPAFEDRRSDLYG